MSPGGPAGTLISRRIQPCRWIPADCRPLERAICERAHADIGIWEEAGSNRGPDVDDYNLRARVPVGSFWCASAVAAWWEDAGAETPAWRAGCDEWMRWGMATRRWSKTPYYGAAVLYGIPGDARHIGVITRLKPVLCSVEGNTIVGVAFSRNGVAVDFKEVALKQVLGYVHVRPLTALGGIRCDD
jgi:hypothetical protein